MNNNNNNPKAILTDEGVTLVWPTLEAANDWLTEQALDYEPSMAVREAITMFADGSCSLLPDFDMAESLGLDGTLRS